MQLSRRLCVVLGVQRTLDRQSAAIKYMSVDHGRFDILMSKQLLHSADVVSVLQQMRRKAVTERMR